MSRVLRVLGAGALTVALGLTLGEPVLAADQEQVTVVASGLDNPRDIVLAPGGVLLVAEAGKGGPGPCMPAPGNPTAQVCLGASGAVSVLVPPRVRPFARSDEATTEQWRQFRLVSGLPSLAGIDGSNAIGPHSLAFAEGRLLATIGFGGTPEARAALGSGSRLMGHVVRLRPFTGPTTPVADLVAYDAAHNPDSGDVSSTVDSNPYGLFGFWDGRSVVADAAANDVLAVDADGNVSTLAVLHEQFVLAPPFLGLPPGATIPMQSVPTTVARGPDGALYIGQLTGFPFVPGGAQVWRLGADGALTPYASGFTNIIDITFDRRGRLLVLSHARDGLLNVPPGELPIGSLIRVGPDGSRTELATGSLVAPGGVVVAGDGTIYVTNKAVVPGGGEVLRIHA